MAPDDAPRGTSRADKIPTTNDELILAAAFGLIGLLFVLQSWALGWTTDRGLLGPGAFPVAVGALFTLLSPVVFYQAFKNRSRSGFPVNHPSHQEIGDSQTHRTEPPPNIQSNPGTAATTRTGSGSQMVLCIALTGVFVGLLPTLGFTTIAILFTVAIQCLLGWRNWKGVLASILAAAGIAYVFIEVLAVPLPRGVLF